MTEVNRIDIWDIPGSEDFATGIENKLGKQVVAIFVSVITSDGRESTWLASDPRLKLKDPITHLLKSTREGIDERLAELRKAPKPSGGA
jgi:hypothetical protein